MCRLTAYSGKLFCPADLVTRPSHSVVRQSFDARERIVGDGWTPPFLNGDGYGLGWYANRHDTSPCLYKAVRPAWNDPNLCDLAEKLQVSMFFAHVRAASQGMDVSETTCHPFREGKYLWMHNGAIAGFFQLRPKILSILRGRAFDFALKHGTSDSAWCFALFLNELDDVEEEMPPHVLVETLRRAMRVLSGLIQDLGIREMSLLNFVFTDGQTLLATKYTIAPDNRQGGPWASLYWGSGSDYVANPEDPSNYSMAHSDRRAEMVIVTSEPLSDEAGDWISIPPDHILVVTKELDVIVQPIEGENDRMSRVLEGLSACPLRRVESMKQRDLAVVCAIEPVYSVRVEMRIVSLCLSLDFLFCGTSSGVIRVWDVVTHVKKQDMVGHSRGVLALMVSESPRNSASLLISGSADNSIRIWDAVTRNMLRRIDFAGCGDVYSLATLAGRLFVGFRDGAIRDVSFEILDADPTVSSMRPPPVKLTHNGYVFSLTTCELSISPTETKRYLCSGSGDALVRIWDPDLDRPVRVLEGHLGAVMALVTWGECLYSGSRDGTIRWWDLDTFHCRKAVRHGSEVLALCADDNSLFSGGQDKFITVWDRETLHARFRLGSASVQCLALCTNSNLLFSGGVEDTSVLAWKTHDPNDASLRPCPQKLFRSSDGEGGQMNLEDVFSTWISFPSVSGEPDHRDACWDAAKYLVSVLEELGATSTLVMSQDRSYEANPLVLGKFCASDPSAPTVVFYGHYDVQPAEDVWQTNPWKLVFIDGYYYGRGASDNKGPILAFVFAVKDFLEQCRGSLPFNITLCIEGQGEARNVGFREMVLANLPWFQNASVLVTANSYWIHDERPCLTYGMRGSVDFTITVSGSNPTNLHSGVDGGACLEPMSDLVTILAELIDPHGRCRVPRFYDDVRPLSHEEELLYHEVEEDMRKSNPSKKASERTQLQLKKRWSSPSMSITSIESSNSTGAFSVIPRSVCAKVSTRIVPDQDALVLQSRIRQHIEYEFGKCSSQNQIAVTFEPVGDYWLADPSVRTSQVAKRAIERNWSIKPLLVREGGTMPVTSFLSKLLGCDIVQIPLGQSSDNAHLPDERIRALNLSRGRAVLRDFLAGLQGEENEKLREEEENEKRQGEENEKPNATT